MLNGEAWVLAISRMEIGAKGLLMNISRRLRRVSTTSPAELPQSFHRSMRPDANELLSALGFLGKPRRSMTRTPVSLAASRRDKENAAMVLLACPVVG